MLSTVPTIVRAPLSTGTMTVTAGQSSLLDPRPPALIAATSSDRPSRIAAERRGSSSSGGSGGGQPSRRRADVVGRVALVEHRLECGAHRGDPLDDPKTKPAILSLDAVGKARYPDGGDEDRDVSRQVDAV